MTRIRLKWNTGRGMPPIFGFFGKVTAKGKKANLKAVILLILNLVYLTAGGFAFVAIENNEKFQSKRLSRLNAAKEDLKFFLLKPYNASDSDNITHVEGKEPWTDEHWNELHATHSARCFKLDNFHAQANLWNFWSAFDFSATVLTTIGYGSMSPRTTLGRYVCIAYFCIGFPIMAMYLALFSKGVCAFVNASITLFSNCMSKIDRNFRLSDLTTRAFSLAVLFMTLVVFVCMWSGILSNTNKADSFVKCMYFYVITLTTVGLGDISMTEARPFVLIRVLFLFCVGLTIVTSVFNALRALLAAHARMLKAKGRRLTSRAQEVVIDGANKLIRHNNNGDGQTQPLTKSEEAEGEFGSRQLVETTFSMNKDDENVGFNSSYNYKNYPYNNGK